MRPELVLAIDLGTSGPKVALVSTEGDVLACTSAPTTLHVLPGGGAEQDPHEWWSAIVTATQALWREGHDAKHVIAVCVTAQWAGCVPVDRDGVPLHRAITWMDTRGAKYMAARVGGVLRLQGYGAGKLARWVQKTGGIPSLAGKEPVAHIEWLRHERPRVHRDAHLFLEPKDWLNHRLCGRFCATYDSIALHWVTDNRDIDHIGYDEKLLAMAGIARRQLPELVPATAAIGMVTPAAAAELGLGSDVRVFGGTPDVQSAAIGSGAARDFEPHLYIGTSSWLSCHVPFKKTDLLRNVAALPSALPGRYFAANSQETAGACVNWLRDHVIWPDDAAAPGAPPADALARIDALAATVAPGSEGVAFAPWLFGERCPAADPDVRGAFTGLSLRSSRAHLARAVLEGVALNTRWLLEAVEHFVGRRLDAIRMIGGGASSALWCQIHADVLDREVLQVEDPVRCNARGAAFVALLGLGRLHVDDIAAKVPVAARYRPQAAHRAVYQGAFAAQRELWKQHRDALRSRAPA
ncbi:MAG: FGGY-family carbohydrate kinase [Deltaproteobacteria bacterium]|nr:FGGY-family carbohydrate kinase [Deltaproteobacteria bacterium]MBK8234156.1 FGGY-family carbohydrate kinase [Deltaproteobacteria bacterium]MBK8714883.1 FGGY-family carbohydrate kinase [Deltaproteobacteria bacterium]